MKLTSRNIMLCEMSAELFRLACKKGYDSREFIVDLLNSEEGQLLYSDKCLEMWLGATYVLEGVEQEVKFKHGIVINTRVMEWIGYLLKCWNLTYPEENLRDILMRIGLDTLIESYVGLHVMSCEDAILNLKELVED